MTEPTNTDKERYVAERLGLEWIEKPPHAPGCICYTCNHYNTPTFLDPAGRIQLLELMMGREDFGEFWNQVHSGYVRVNLYRYIGTEFILDNTGLLLDAAHRFLREKEEV
jgi:hypothetical protein